MSEWIFGILVFVLVIVFWLLSFCLVFVFFLLCFCVSRSQWVSGSLALLFLSFVFVFVFLLLCFGFCLFVLFLSSCYFVFVIVFLCEPSEWVDLWHSCFRLFVLFLSFCFCLFAVVFLCKLPVSEWIFGILVLHQFAAFSNSPTGIMQLRFPLLQNIYYRRVDLSLYYVSTFFLLQQHIWEPLLSVCLKLIRSLD